MFIQETHWTMTDYTKIREDWNIEIFIAGNSSSARGTAILLNKTFEYKINNPIVDAIGRYVILDIDIALLGRITLVSIYAPNEQIEHFIDELFEKINTLNNVFHIIGGDWNMIQNFKLDTYNYEKWNNKKASEHLGKEKTEFELVDIWRTKNTNTTRFSWWKKTPRKAGRLDFFLVTEQLISTVGKVEILSPYKSDHGTITMELIISKEQRGPGSWKLNTNLLKDKDLQLKIREEIKLIKRTYALTPYEQENLEINDINVEYSINPDLLWEVMLVQIRGIIIEFAKKKKKQEYRREKELNKQIAKL